MSDTSTNPAEPTENQGGGNAPAPDPESNVTTEEAAPAEPPENQGGGSD